MVRHTRRRHRSTVAAVATTIVAFALAPLGLWAIADQVISAAHPTTHPTGGTDGGGHDPVPQRSTATDGYRVWGHNEDGTPIRWDPCAPIRLEVNPTGGPDGWRGLFDEAVTRVRDASGLDIVVTTTDERPRADRPAFEPSRWDGQWAPVLVAWTSASETDLPMFSTDRGLAMPLAVGREGDRSLVSGQIVFNAERVGDDEAGLPELTLDFDDRATAWGAVMLHELLHLIGLDHVDDPDQLMFSLPGTGPVAFGQGDLEGLDALTSADCRPAPEPGPVEVLRVTPR